MRKPDRPYSAHRALRVLPLLLSALLSRALAQSAERLEKLAEGTWTFSAQNNGSARSRECADTMTHGSVKRYRNIWPKIPGAEVYAARWRFVTVNGQQCTRSNGPLTATIFVRQDPRPDSPFFLTGEDNSPRRCGTWTQTLPARYYFTSDLPKYREFFVDYGFLSPTQNASDIVNARKGEIFMMSQQFSPLSNDSAASTTVCFYKKAELTAIPLLSPDAFVAALCAKIGC